MKIVFFFFGKCWPEIQSEVERVTKPLFFFLSGHLTTDTFFLLVAFGCVNFTRICFPIAKSCGCGSRNVSFSSLWCSHRDSDPDHSKGSIGCPHFKSGSALAGNARQNRCIRRTCCKRVAPLTLQHWTLLPTCMYELHRVYHENVSLRIEICRASLTVPTPMLLLGLYKCVVSTRATSCVRTKGAHIIQTHSSMRVEAAHLWFVKHLFFDPHCTMSLGNNRGSELVLQKKRALEWNFPNWKPDPGCVS